MSNLQRKAFFNPQFLVSAEERIEAARQADQCIKWLKAQGFEVSGIQKGISHPRVFFRPSPLCKSLDGSVHRFERLNGIEKRYWFAIRFGCEVRWNDEVYQPTCPAGRPEAEVK